VGTQLFCCIFFPIHFFSSYLFLGVLLFLWRLTNSHVKTKKAAEKIFIIAGVQLLFVFFQILSLKLDNVQLVRNWSWFTVFGPLWVSLFAAYTVCCKPDHHTMFSDNIKVLDPFEGMLGTIIVYIIVLSSMICLRLEELISFDDHLIEFILWVPYLLLLLWAFSASQYNWSHRKNIFYDAVPIFALFVWQGLIQLRIWGIFQLWRIFLYAPPMFYLGALFSDYHLWSTFNSAFQITSVPKKKKKNKWLADQSME